MAKVARPSGSRLHDDYMTTHTHSESPPRDLANKKMQKPSYEITHFRLVLAGPTLKNTQAEAQKKQIQATKFTTKRLQSPESGPEI